MGVVVKRFDIYLISLDPTVGSEIQKIRPCLVVSPDNMNRYSAVVIVAPMTTQARAYPTRISCQFQGKDGQVALDQLRAVDKARLIKRLGRVDVQTQKVVLNVLAEMFAE